MHADISRCHNVKRFGGAGDPITAFVLLQHTQSQNYIAFQDKQVLCIPLQDNESRCTFICVLRIENDDLTLTSVEFKHKDRKR